MVWKCMVCGHEHRGDRPPSTCPVCGVGSDLFQAQGETDPTAASPVVEKLPSGQVDGFRCMVCGYIHEGPEPPDRCPVCGVGRELFQRHGEVEVLPPPTSQAEGFKILVLGGGIGGVSAAERIAARRPDAAVTIVSQEPGLPCFRLNLTPYLAGVEGTALTIHEKKWYDERKIRMVSGEVTHIEADAHVVTLRDGNQLPYDHLILATGSHPFVPPIPGVRREGVFSLRTLSDAEGILRSARGGKAVIIGGGLLGLEAAAALARRGCGATVLESAPSLMPRQLAVPAARMLETFLEKSGVQVISGAQVTSIDGDETVGAVSLADGRRLPADIVILAVGVRPNVFLPSLVGLRTGRGVLVDDQMRTSIPDILAAGDVAEHRGVVWGLWTAALAQGAVAGETAAGGQAAFLGLPASTRLKVAGLDVFSIGVFDGADIEAREFLEENRYLRVAVRDGVVVGANLVGDLASMGLLREAVERRSAVAEIDDLFPKARGV